MFDRFLGQGDLSALNNFINSTTNKFLQVKPMMLEFVKGHRDRGPGKKSSVSGKDMFVKLLTMLKYGSQ